MAYGMRDRVREQVSSFGGGTGAVTLPNVAVSSFQTFLAGWGASGTGDYCLVLGSQWETGFGTLNAGGTSLTRTTVYDGSSGADVAVNFSAGTMDCFGDVPAELAHHTNMREIAVASATTCDIGAVRGARIEISGTTTITGFGTSKNRLRFVRFSGALLLTYNVTSLILPAAKNITTVAGDTAVFASDSSGNWRCMSYQRGAGNKQPTVQRLTSGTAATYTTPAGVVRIEVRMVGGGGGGAGAANTGTTIVAGAAGTATTFNSIDAAGGAGATNDAGGGAGGTGGTGSATTRRPGQAGQGTTAANAAVAGSGGSGGTSFFGGGGLGQNGNTTGAGSASAANTGGGGGGAMNRAGANFNSAGGGGAGEYAYLDIASPAGTYTYTVGPGGAGGSSSSSGGAGGSGFIEVTEHYAV